MTLAYTKKENIPSYKVERHINNTLIFYHRNKILSSSKYVLKPFTSKYLIISTQDAVL